MPRLTFDQIASIMFELQQQHSPLLREMIKVRDRYNGDTVIPMWGTQDDNPARGAQPMVIANAIDNLATRAGSVSPAIFCPALDDSIDVGPRSRDLARQRQRALAYTWAESKLNLGLRRTFRHLSGYMTSAFDVQPDFDYGGVCIKVRDPLSCYPEPKAAEDLSCPGYVGYVFTKSRQWVIRNYPEATPKIGTYNGYMGYTGNQMWRLVEWIDEYDIVLGLLGPAVDYIAPTDQLLRYSLELKRWPNLAGRCTSYIPARVTLDRIANQVANMVGAVDLMTMLTELEVRATENSVFPDRYIIAKTGKAPQLVGGEWREGATGKVNIIMDADGVGNLRGSPDPHNSQLIDRLERNINVTAGVVPQMSGENMGSLRTGRALDSIFSASIDPRIQEMHEIVQIALTEVNEIAADAWKGWFGRKKVVGFSGWPTDQGIVEFDPAEIFETHYNAVTYPIPGADVQTTTVILGQLHGADDALSLDSFRELHPYISDAVGERQRSLVNQLERIILEALAQRASSGGIPPDDMAKILKMLRDGSDLVDAIITIDEEARKRQAQIAQASEEQGEPQMAAPPGAMPGLGNPGEGGQQQLPPPIQQPPLGLDNYRQLVRNLRIQPGAPPQPQQ